MRTVLKVAGGACAACLAVATGWVVAEELWWRSKGRTEQFLRECEALLIQASTE